MKQHMKWFLVEVIAVGLILIILCAVMVPRFLQKQKNGAPYRLIKHFQVLLDAMEQYQTDYGSIPLKKSSVGALIRNTTAPTLKNDTLHSYYLSENIEHLYRVFYERGYLDTMPDFSEFDPYLYSIKTDSPYSQHHRTTNTLKICIFGLCG